MPSTTLLGYDWAAAVVDDSRQRGSRAYLDNKSEELSSLSSFRQRNSSSCVGPSRLSDLDAEIRALNPKLDFGSGKSKAEDDEDEDAEEEKRRKLQVDSHVCVFPYEIADRLFARPLTTQAQNSTSVACAVCGKGRSSSQPPSSLPPSSAFASSSTTGEVVKVTLDRRRLLPDYSSPYIPKPKSRRSFDSSNSMSLASHLLKGSRPLRNSDIPPTTKSLALRRNLRKGGGGGSNAAVDVDQSSRRNLRSGK